MYVEGVSDKKNAAALILANMWRSYYRCYNNVQSRERSPSGHASLLVAHNFRLTPVFR